MKPSSTPPDATRRDNPKREAECEREKWRSANCDAIEQANAELATNGLWSDGLRPF